MKSWVGIDVGFVVAYKHVNFVVIIVTLLYQVQTTTMLPFAF